MFKHIIGQTIFQLIVMCVLVFAGENFIPEFEDGFESIDGFQRDFKYSPSGTIRSGRDIFYNGEPDYETVF